jgi:ribosomal protein S18 acetylase RimI-like enzyme
MKITEASLADIPVICRLVNAAYRGDTSRKGWTTEADLLEGMRVDEDMLTQYLQQENSVILTCKDEADKMIGCVYLKKEKELLYLGMLTVDPELQAKGIGKMLLKASEQRARKEGCSAIVITVISERHELVSWYERKGFVKTGETVPFPVGEKFGIPVIPLELVLMQKTLQGGV